MPDLTQPDLDFNRPYGVRALTRPQQTNRLLSYLREFGNITPIEALRDLGIMRLGAGIWELKRRDPSLQIQSDLVEIPNRWNQVSRVARYTLCASGGLAAPVRPASEQAPAPPGQGQNLPPGALSI